MFLKDLHLNESNPRQIKGEKFEKLKKSVKEFERMLELRPIIIDDDNVILGGNMRYRALEALGYTEIPDAWVKRASGLTDEQKKEFLIKDNVGYGEWDFDVLFNEWDTELLKDWGVDLPNFNIAGYEGKGKEGSLQDRYVVPPFTVLDTRKGYWKERKEKWRRAIGDNGESREGALASSGIVCSSNNGVSILDPVLAEVVVDWFGIEGGLAFDVFAGDTVFGYVASALGLSFTGVELRQEQADLNNSRTKGMSAKYICDDGRNVMNHIAECSQDLLFSCPPYFDLEVYSELPNDASNQETYEDFIAIIDTAFTNAIKCLKNDRFAVIVCGDIRDKEGAYRCFPDDIKKIFLKNNCVLYNELVLVEMVGTARLRCNNRMKTRKIIKTHQNVLVFYKGDIKHIKDNYKPIEYAGEDLESFTVD